MLRVVVLKVAALFSYCGGPLFLGELLKPRLGAIPSFVITFLPVGLMVLGAIYLDDDPRSRWALAAVRAGRLGLYIVLGMHAYAVWRFMNGVHVREQGLYYFGIAVGLAWSVAYLYAARRWTASVTDSAP